MRLEPQLDGVRLLACAASAYGLALRGLTYIPQGEASFSYIAEATGGARYILKVFDQARLGRIAAERMAHVMPLLIELRSKSVLTNIPQPVFTTDGRTLASCGDNSMALFDYVPGENPGDRMLHRPGIWTQLAADVGRLHAAAPSLTSTGLGVETYGIPFERALLDGVAALGEVADGDPPGARALADLLLPQHGTLMAMLKRLKELGSLARDLASPTVLCHTDIHSLNLLIDPVDRLTILDWDGAKWAPAEHDLFAFTGDDFPAFLDAYLGAGGVRSLHAETFGFYFYRRNLEDLTDFIVRILYEDDDTQAEMDIDAAQSECLAGWPFIESGIDGVRKQLQAAQITP